MKKILATLACAFLSTAAFAGEFPDISVAELDAAIAKKEVIVIDVNGTTSHKTAHIPGAIDFQANQDKIAELLGDDKDKLVVAYCGGPKCSAYQRAAKAAKDAGFTNVKHLSAGISGWKAAEKATEAAE